MKKLLFLTLIAFSTFAQKTAKTANGKIEGYEKENLRISKGISFATPPIGNLRWKAPQAPKNWTGILKCNEFSASPMQVTQPITYCEYSGVKGATDSGVKEATWKH